MPPHFQAHVSSMSGLSSGSQNVIAELQDQHGQEILVDLSADVAPGDNDMEWETLPTELKDDESFVHAIRDVHNSQLIPFHQRYCTGFADAFEAYLAILCAVNKQVSEALGRTTPNWRVLNACPPCRYELEGEPKLVFHRMIAFNGNESLKCLELSGDRAVGDTQIFTDSDYYLELSFVDPFAHEVKSRQAEVISTSPGDGSANVDDNDVTEEPTEDDTTLASCADNRKAAHSDSKKRMWGIFQETGLFASACRHLLVLWIADMIHSGEQAKYPLAMVAKALEVFGEHTLMAYDVGCNLGKTIHTSSLGEPFNKLNVKTTLMALLGWEEIEYFKTLGKEPEWDIHTIAYVELLQELRDLNTPADYTFTSLASPVNDRHLYDTNLSQTQKKETECRHLAECWDNTLHEVIAMEVKMGIATRWQPSDPEYIEMANYMLKRKYHLALDNLQHLVVLQLFELHKLNLSQTGNLLFSMCC
ncbi:hypothetical protein PILCRDRAFT_3755 [Piloderma croceum F 1598]|uniref:CxC2-like cysteine cluster KDZ transposase-associated domain-containing protein n=1 Tax=Piloderma croceum (strain F 1598) TaxID=765440 RepID=A0A0C3FUH6_PILCF|nr:hypothetical protein PILCRDRAFT_3755 [Piloderma croceum F 1598]